MAEVIINSSHLKEFRDFIERKCGIYLQDVQLRVLKNHIISRMSQHRIEDAEEYFNKNFSEINDSPELKHLLVQILNNETSFFRNVPQFNALNTFVLPDLAKQKEEAGNKELNIWSAGCSTGEEPYSVAISLLESLPSLSSWTINILATDIDVIALRDAKHGVFLEQSLRNMTDHHKKTYFTFTHDRYCINRNIKDFVSFQEFNLAASQYPRPQCGHWDIILFRNVMIYFREAFIRNVIQKMSSIISENSYLFLGHSETLQHISDDFELLSIEQSFIYRKNVMKKETADMTEIKKNVDSSCVPKARNEKRIGVKKPCKDKKRFTKKVISADIINSVTEYIETNRYKDAIKTLEREVILHPLDEKGHYYLGISYYNEKDFEKAAKELKATIYINAENFMARFFLGKTYHHMDIYDRAATEFRNALKILDSCEQDKREVIEGFPKEALKKMCENYIKYSALYI